MWELDDHPVDFSNSAYMQEGTQSNSTLIISDITGELTGRYRCRVGLTTGDFHVALTAVTMSKSMCDCALERLLGEMVKGHQLKKLLV